MKKSLKKNNKGFSLVELIVVIAIMAILAVTLAPRLVQYVDRARQASDQEAVNTIFTAAKLAYLEDPTGLTLAANNDGTADAVFQLRGTGDSSLFNVTGKDWELSTAYTGYPAAGPETANAYVDSLKEILGNFELKSSDAGDDTTITIQRSATAISVTLDYDGAGSIEPYVVSE